MKRSSRPIERSSRPIADVCRLLRAALFKTAACLVAAALLTAAHAEVNTVRVARNYGTAYLQLMVMQSQGLI